MDTVAAARDGPSFNPSPTINTCRPAARSRSISATDSSTLCTGSTMEARSRGSRSSHSLAIQSFTARANTAPISSLNGNCTPYRQFRIAVPVPNGSSACAASCSTVVAVRPSAPRQSARVVIGAFVG